ISDSSLLLSSSKRRAVLGLSLVAAAFLSGGCSSEAEFHPTPCPTTHIGRLSVKANVVNCPTITSFEVAPTQLGPGQIAHVSATAIDVDTPVSDLTFSWTAPVGSFADPSAPETTYTCEGPGAVTITLTVSDDGCSDTTAVPISCSGP